MTQHLSTPTRRRILDAALVLLNELGSAAVTTAEIAAAAGMSEGNLHYHFRKKSEIVAALLESFEAELLAVAAQDLADPAQAASYTAYNFGWFRLMWRFRCFYRDHHAAAAIAPGVAPRLSRMQVAAQAQARAVLGQAAAHGLITGSDAELDRLMVNVWIVASYWMDYRRAVRPGVVIDRAELQWGFGQILGLYAPYVTPAGRALAAPPSDADLDRLFG